LPTLAGRTGTIPLAEHCDTGQVLQIERTTLLGHTMVGAAVSGLTVTVKVHVLRLVQASVATQFTVLVPMGNGLPEAGVQVTVTVPELSEAAGAG
jgi:hypothetical protein